MDTVHLHPWKTIGMTFVLWLYARPTKSLWWLSILSKELYGLPCYTLPSTSLPGFGRLWLLRSSKLTQTAESWLAKSRTSTPKKTGPSQPSGAFGTTISWGVEVWMFHQFHHGWMQDSLKLSLDWFKMIFVLSSGKVPWSFPSRIAWVRIIRCVFFHDWQSQWNVVCSSPCKFFEIRKFLRRL